MPKCSDCQKHVYTIPEGKLETYEVEDERGRLVELPVLRELPPPCEHCPKGGPQNEISYVLGPRNAKALRLYERLEATFGQYQVPERLRNCKVFAENMRIIRAAKKEGLAMLKQRLYEEAEKERTFGR